MDTERLEKQFQMWNRFMYVVLGASITLVTVGLGDFLEGNRWPGFDNFIGGVWQWVQLLATPPGFYLLLGKRWKTMPLSNRLNTIFGYFIASWLSFFALGLITANNAPTELGFLIIGSAILIALGYIWALKRTLHPRDEMFP